MILRGSGNTGEYGDACTDYFYMRGSFSRDLVVVLPVLGFVVGVAILFGCFGAFTPCGSRFIRGREGNRVQLARRHMHNSTYYNDDDDEDQFGENMDSLD